MEIKLKFLITLTNGEETTQEIVVPADPKLPFEQQQTLLMNQMFSQYSQVGLLRQPTPGTFVLLCPSQIAFVECQVSSILMANSADVRSIEGLIKG